MPKAKKRRFLTEITDRWSIPMLKTAFRLMLLSGAMGIVGELSAWPELSRCGIMVALADLILVTAFVVLVYIFVFIDKRHWPTGTPDPDHPGLFIVWY
jgi:hypothetical protein